MKKLTIVTRITEESHPGLFAMYTRLRDDGHVMQREVARALRRGWGLDGEGEPPSGDDSGQVLQKLQELPGEFRQILDAALSSVTFAVRDDESGEDDAGDLFGEFVLE